MDRWGDDSAAWAQLHGRFRVVSAFSLNGLIVPLPGVKPTADDESAIDFLFQEFDYGYTPCNRGHGGLPCGRDKCGWCGADAP